MDKITEIYRQYELGRAYKSRINLYHDVDLNERYYAGDQWVGVQSNGLPLPVLNFIRRVGNYLVASIKSRTTTLVFTAENESLSPADFLKVDQMPDAFDRFLSQEKYVEGKNPRISGAEKKAVAQLFTEYSKRTWERLKMESNNLKGLLDAFNSGDYIAYFHWDEEIETGQDAKGDIAMELIDNVNTYFGDPNCKEIQKQPYIIIAFREMVENVKSEAARNGASKAEIASIVADDDTSYQAGDRGKIELEDGGKCLCLLKLWRSKNPDGHYSVKAMKATKGAVIRKAWDLKLPIYPIALMNWKERKNSIHGIAETTGLIPNQVAVNKILAMEIVSTMNTAYPKVLLDENCVDGWNNAVGAVIPVRDGVEGKVKYLEPPVGGGNSLQLASYLVANTKDAMAANDMVMGNGEIQNTSAFLAMREAAAIPLESIQQRFYRFIEDVGQIWAAFWVHYYSAERILNIQSGGSSYYVRFDGRRYRNILFSLKTEVGPSSLWSELSVISSLDKLLQGGQISFLQYLERIPDGYIPNKAELMAEIKGNEK